MTVTALCDHTLEDQNRAARPLYSIPGFSVEYVYTGCPKKNVAMFQLAITPSKMALGIKVGSVLKSSGSPLTDGH